MPAYDGALLVLEATGPEAERLAGGRRKEFASGELGTSSAIPKKGTIGRAEDNDWVLPHPLVSGYHATIKYANGVFYITDTSTNGVFLTSRTNRLIKGQPHPISNGDVIIIEPFRLEASVTAAGAADVPLVRAEPPLIGEPLPPPIGPPVTLPPIAGGYPAQGGEDPFHVRAEPLRGAEGPLVEPGSPDELDLDDLFGGSPGGGQAGHGPSGAEILQGGSAINDQLPPVRVGQVPEQPPPPQNGAWLPPDWNDSSSSVGQGGQPAGGRPGGGQPVGGQPGPSAGARGDVWQGGGTAPGQRAPEVRVPAKPPERDSGASVLAAILAGAGLPNAPVTQQLASNLGEILRIVVSGLIEALHARREIKGEFGMRGTIVAPTRNNPLKFSANVNDALHNLLVKQNPAYLGPVEAFEDAFRDLRTHELAMLAGMRAAFDAMLADFQPDRLQALFDRNVKKGILGAKPEYWEMFRQRLEDLARDPETTFRILFGDRFVRAYQEQLDRLNEQGRARKP